MNSGSFEQITTSWLIEKTGGSINWKFTHRAKVSTYIFYCLLIFGDRVPYL